MSLIEVNPKGRWTVNMATSRTAAIGKLTNGTRAPSSTARPPNNSVPYCFLASLTRSEHVSRDLVLESQHAPARRTCQS